jgi:phosphopantothenoylcysteine decarboxylase/phosphopantothenate--cysteine ligase
MRIIVTAGPTREYIDSVRFITNASSGKMGYACAAAAAEAGHSVTLISGPGTLHPPKGLEFVPIVSVEELRQTVAGRFPRADALIMAAAVGDFTVQQRLTKKMSRSRGPLQITLLPTEDVLASVASTKQPDQTIVAFAVEDGPPEQAQEKARAEMADKGADYVVVNPPSAMAADEGEAAILSRDGVVLPWGRRSKVELAHRIVHLLGRR